MANQISQTRKGVLRAWRLWRSKFNLCSALEGSDTTTTKTCVSDWLRLIWLFDCLRWRSWKIFYTSTPLSTVQLSELSPQIASWCWKDCSELINVSCSEQSKTIIANFPSLSPLRVTCELCARTGVYGQEWVTTSIESSLAQSIIIRSSYTTSNARERLPTSWAPVEGEVGGGVTVRITTFILW